MFYHLVLPLKEYISFLRLFQYITFRSAYAALTALLLVLLLGNIVIKQLEALKLREEIRKVGPESHQRKAGTPTMGGIMIIGAVLVSIFLWGNFTSLYLNILIGATILLGALGFADDYIKSILKRKEGIPAKIKFFFQILIALAAALLIYYFPSNKEEISNFYVPFINEEIVDMKFWWIIFAVVVIVAATNAVNFTDGLDGLAIGSVIIVGVSLGLMAYLTGHSKIAGYLRIPYVPDAAEITVYIAALIGASLGFLWFNTNPAAVFMGDTGSLALGGIIGITAVMIKKEVFLFIVGGVLVVEVASVIIQVASFKLRGKRIFKMSPIHHHFELSGMSEQKVVVRMWILGIILAILGLSSLKIL